MLSSPRHWHASAFWHVARISLNINRVEVGLIIQVLLITCFDIGDRLLLAWIDNWFPSLDLIVSRTFHFAVRLPTFRLGTRSVVIFIVSWTGFWSVVRYIMIIASIYSPHIAFFSSFRQCLLSSYPSSSCLWLEVFFLGFKYCRQWSVIYVVMKYHLLHFRPPGPFHCKLSCPLDWSTSASPVLWP